MPRPPGDTVDLEEARKEATLLRKIRLTSLTANPKTIAPFEDSTLAWKLFVPAEAESIVGLGFTLGGAAVDRTGSKLVSPHQTGAFQLKAHGELTSRILGEVVVTVDVGSCQQLELRAQQLRPQAEKLRDRFLAGSITARGPVDVKTSEEGLRIFVPLDLAIENFFDAEANVVLKLLVSARAGRAEITLIDVDVDVTFSLAEHILSLGSATFLQSAIQPLAEDLILAFLGAQLQGDLSGEINIFVNALLKVWQGADPKDRKFKLYSITTTSAGIIFMGCPDA